MIEPLSLNARNTGSKIGRLDTAHHDDEMKRSLATSLTGALPQCKTDTTLHFTLERVENGLNWGFWQFPIKL